MGNATRSKQIIDDAKRNGLSCKATTNGCHAQDSTQTRQSGEE
jgi:hypothetical protein